MNFMNLRCLFREAQHTVVEKSQADILPSLGGCHKLFVPVK